MIDGLTREQVLAQWDNMTPRERDALIAEKVMGWTIRRQIVLTYDSNPLATFRTLYAVTDGRGMDWSPTYDLDGVGLPHYSTDISAAFEVWENDRPEDWYMNLHWSKGKYVTEIIRENPEDGYKYLAQVESESAAEAMTKCRLLAVMGE